jgi:hypothetical protein
MPGKEGFSRLLNMDLPSRTTAENWHVLIDFWVQEFTLQRLRTSGTVCNVLVLFVTMGIEKLQSFHGLFLYIEFLHPTPESLIMV